MIKYIAADKENIELVMGIRLEMLKEVNGLDENYQYDDSFVAAGREYFLDGDQTTVLALKDGRAIGCASMCYINVMPTFEHPTGQRAHLMNVYTSKYYRRQGIAEKMVDMLIEEAWERGATEISLDTTEAGRDFYRKVGFVDSGECMVKIRK